MSRLHSRWGEGNKLGTKELGANGECLDDSSLCMCCYNSLNVMPAIQGATLSRVNRRVEDIHGRDAGVLPSHAEAARHYNKTNEKVKV